MILGELISQYRKSHNCSMDAFAKMCGLSKAYISILERNSNPVNGKPPIPSLETIKAVSQVIGMDFNTVIELLDDKQQVQLGAPFRSTLGNLAKLKRVSPEELSARTGFSLDDVNCWMVNERALEMLDEETLKRLTDALDLPLIAVTNPLQYNFQDRLRAARLARGYTQQQVADLLGITKSAYCGYETGKRKPDVAKIKQLAIVLNVSGDELLETGTAQPIVPEYTPHEKDMIRKYRMLDDRGRAVVDSILDHEYQAALGDEADPLPHAD